MHLKRGFSRLLILMPLILLSGCIPHRAATTSQLTAPGGVVIPAGTTADKPYRGLYLARGAEDGCCWTQPTATLTLRKRYTASRIGLVFYLPDGNEDLQSWFASNPVTLSVTILGAVRHNCCYKGGVSGVTVPLPRSLWKYTGALTIQIRTDPAFTLSKIDHGSKDSRALGILLLRVFFY